MTTLNRVVEGLNRIATAHTQINTFFFGDVWEFATSGTTTYPAMAVHLENSSLTRRLTNLTMDIYIMDKVRNGESNETEVLSDMLLVSKDILSEITHPDWSWNVRNEDTITIEPFTEKLQDTLTGCKMTVIFQLVTPNDTCQIPEGSITRI